MARRFGLAAAIAVLTLSTSVVGAQAVKQQGASVAATRAATNKTWDDLLDAAKKGDAKTAASAYTADALIIDPAMANVSGRTNIEQMARDWYKTTKFLGLTRKASAFEVYGDVAIENGTATASFQEKGKPVTKADGRYTVVWKNVNGKWLIHRDVTTPMPPK